MADPLEDLIINGGVDARRSAAELPGIEHSRRGPGDDRVDDDFQDLNDDDGQDQDDASALNDEQADQAGFGRGGQRSGSSRDVMPRSTAESYNTGPKGVMRDQRDHAAAQARADAERIRATNAALQRMALTANTVEEEERLRQREARAVEQAGKKRPDRSRSRRHSSSSHRSDDDQDHKAADQSDGRVAPAAAADMAARERRRAQRLEELQREAERKRAALLGLQMGPVAAAMLPAQRTDVWFGHLREVDAAGYVRATDEERDDVPVVVHIYEKTVTACRVLTAALASLARQYPHTKFVQVRALAVGFGQPEGETDLEDEEEFEDEASLLARHDELLRKVEPVLPTLHIYFGGRLCANLVRVDLDEGWQGGKETAVRDILLHYRGISDVRRNEKGSRHDSDSDTEDT